MFGRFSMAKSATLVPAPYGGVIDGSQFGGGDQTIDVYSGALSWTRIYSPTLVTFEDDKGAYDQKDAQGFIKLNALRLRVAAKRDRRGEN